MKLLNEERDLVIRLHNQGFSFRNISRTLRISHTTVSRMVKKFNATHSTKDLPRSGRPKLISPREERKIGFYMKLGRVSTAKEMVRSIWEEREKKVSLETVRRALHCQRLHGRIIRKKPKLTKVHKKQRYAFALQHLSWTAADWSKVLFSDETKVCLVNNVSRRYCWRGINQEYDARFVKPVVKFGGGSIMLWACMCADGIGWMCKVDNTLDSMLYRDILQDEMTKTVEHYFPDSVFFFQQDNSSVHTAKIIKNYLSQKNIRVLDWPSNSPDLNPIEHLWVDLKRRLDNAEHPINKNQLWDVIQEKWEEISPEVCRKLVWSMPGRIAAVFKAHGGYTRY
jgi:transposase